jgi:repressor of nif and glnA expression
MARQDTQEKYEGGRGHIDKYINKNNKKISKRTVQRALKTLVAYGSVRKSANKYSITKRGERELMFKQFARGYGIMSLNGFNGS